MAGDVDDLVAFPLGHRDVHEVVFGGLEAQDVDGSTVLNHQEVSVVDGDQGLGGAAARAGCAADDGDALGA